MRKIIASFLALFLFTAPSCELVFSQTTVIFKPNATVGKDAFISTQDASPRGTEPQMYMATWTWEGIPQTYRSLIKFDQLATIPTEAIITDVKLVLYGVPNSTIMRNGNNVYPGSTLNDFSNSVLVQRVINNWDENQVTWSNQPQTTELNQVIIPSSTSKWNWNYTIDNTNELRTIIQDMVSNPNSNNGFMLRLAEESIYRGMLFASRDNADSTRWPELQVTYLYNDTCNSNFSYSMPNALDPTTLTFNANIDAGQHIWRYGSQSLSTASSFTHTFTPTNECKELTHEVISSNGNCSTSINLYICNTNQDTTSIEEVNSMSNAEIIISPNPSKDFWNVSINSKEKLRAEIIIRDALGKVVLMDEKNIYIGENNIPINGKNFNKGIYIIEIKGKGINYSQKLIKQ